VSETRSSTALAAASAGANELPIAPGPAPVAHTGKFRFVYLLLTAAAVAVVGLGVYTVTSLEPAKKKAAAEWHPTGVAPFAVTRSIASHYTALKLKGFEPTTSPTVTAARPADLKLAALLIPFPGAKVLVAIPPKDAVYQICGHDEGCALVSPPTVKRELLLRRLVLGMALDTFASARPPKHMLVAMPTFAGSAWFVFYARDEFSDQRIHAARALLARLERTRHPAAQDVAQLLRFTNDHTYEPQDQVFTEDANRLLVLAPRPCMDSACPLPTAAKAPTPKRG